MGGYVIGINYALTNGEELEALKQMALEEGGRKIRGRNLRNLPQGLRHSSLIRKFPDCQKGASFLERLKDKEIRITNVYTYNGKSKGCNI